MAAELPVALTDEVSEALHAQRPIVALETTVIAHGLPAPDNLELAADVQRIIRDTDAVPAFIGVLNGTIRVGLEANELQQLTQCEPLKASSRDLPILIAAGGNGATTVAGTMVCAAQCGQLGGGSFFMIK